MSDRVTYAFHYRSLDNHIIKDEWAINDVANRELTYDDGITWQCIVRDFLGFLSGIYGYDISSRVQFESFDEGLERLREENNLSPDWPFNDEEEDADDEQASSKV